MIILLSMSRLNSEASKPKSSWFNRNGKMELTDLDALERSSNAYMIKLGDEDGCDNERTYEKGGRLNINLSPI